MIYALQLHKEGVSLCIRLTPGAKNDSLAGLAEMPDGRFALKASVTEPPEDGKANKALLKLLAKAFDVPKTSLSLLSGETSRQKVVLISGEGKILMEKIKNELQSIVKKTKSG